ncbi:MAG: hypothetical protein WDN10_04745 [bacterium]
MKKELLVGDVVRSEFGESRIITTKDSTGGCYYIEYTDNRGWFYNPTRAYVSEKQLLEKYRKIGHLPAEILNELQKVIAAAIIKHNEAFTFLDSALNQNEKFNIAKFLSV